MNDGLCAREKIGPHAFLRGETMMTQRNDGLTDHRVHGERDRGGTPGKRLILKGLLPALLIGGLASSGFAASRNDEPTTFPGALNDEGTPVEQVVLWQNWDDGQADRDETTTTGEDDR